MKSKLLEKAFDPSEFKQNGYQIIDILSDYLQEAQQNELPVTKHHKPENELGFWNRTFPIDNYTIYDPIKIFKSIIDRSIHLHNPNYMGHQVAVTAPLAALTNVLTGLLNNGMAIYEMGEAASAIEKITTEFMCKKLGYQEGSGIMTSGGTLANLTALLAARSKMIEKDVWTKGHQPKHVVLVSEEAHYCVDRALRIMGFGDDGIVKIKTDDHFKMDLDELNLSYQENVEEGNHIMAIVGSAPSTSTGAIENLNGIASFCQEKNCWFHVDAAHGGAAIFSPKYNHLLNGVEKADSVVIDAHKMMLTPGIMTFLLFRNKSDSYQTFSQKAQYLWADDHSEEWYNYGKRTFECTKEMMAVKFYILLQTYGEKLFEKYVDNQFDLTREFAHIIKENDHFELATEPDTNILCFRYLSPNHEPNSLNTSIRQKLFNTGEFYIVQTKLKGKVFLRVTIMNHLTNKTNFQKLISKIEELVLLLKD